jgi:hypothetical protein
MVDRNAVPARLYLLANEDRGDVVRVQAVVLVPGHDQQAVVRHRPGDVAAQMRAQPCVARRDRAVVHVVAQVRDHESDGRQFRVPARREPAEWLIRSPGDIGEIGPWNVLSRVLT